MFVKVYPSRSANEAALRIVESGLYVPLYGTYLLGRAVLTLRVGKRRVLFHGSVYDAGSRGMPEFLFYPGKSAVAKAKTVTLRAALKGIATGFRGMSKIFVERMSP